MTRSKYLRIVGYVELISSIIGIAVGFVYMISLSFGATWALDVVGAPKPLAFFIMLLYWALFLAACFFAPAIGVLFLAVADLLDQQLTTGDLASGVAPVENKVKKLDNRIEMVEKDLYLMKNPRGERINVITATKEPENQKETIKDEETKTTSKVSSEEKKKTYSIDSKVKFNEDYLIDGTQVKKGQTGVIVDVLISFAGRQYAVILDDNGERVLAREGHFKEL